MKKTFTLVCLGLAACDSSLHADRRLQRGMTEQEVTQLQGKQVPDHIIMRTCGTENAPTVSLQGSCLSEGTVGRQARLRGRRRLRGQWVVSQWL